MNSIDIRITVSIDMKSTAVARSRTDSYMAWCRQRVCHVGCHSARQRLRASAARREHPTRAMSDPGVMTEAQEVAWAFVNNNWPIATYKVNEHGIVDFECDDGDTGTIQPNGDWEWD